MFSARKSTAVFQRSPELQWSAIKDIRKTSRKSISPFASDTGSSICNCKAACYTLTELSVNVFKLLTDEVKLNYRRHIVSTFQCYLIPHSFDPRLLMKRLEVAKRAPAQALLCAAMRLPLEYWTVMPLETGWHRRFFDESLEVDGYMIKLIYVLSLISCSSMADTIYDFTERFLEKYWAMVYGQLCVTVYK